MKIVSFLMLCLLFSLFACRQGNINRDAQVNKNCFSHGAVVSAHPYASQVGKEILHKGGNAVDAAIATAFALEVVYPEAGNIGGGGFMVIRLANGEANTLDFRETAPAAATRDMYLDKEGNVIPDLSYSGCLSVGVPGVVDGMFQAHLKYGKLDWKELVQPSIDLARKGIVLTEKSAAALNEVHQDLLKFNPGLKYLSSSSQWKKGDVLRQEDLAATLELIRDKGSDGFYKGVTAERIEAQMKKNKGLITKEDLLNYHSLWRKPVTGFYRGYSLITMPPPSSGGVALLQLLKMVEPFPLTAMGFHSAKVIHLTTEAENRVFADRATWMGDPGFFHVPVRQLLDSTYLQKRMSDFNPDHSTPSGQVKAGEIQAGEKEETTHYSVVDQWGNAVSVTTTLNGGFGSRVFVEGSGFLLNDEMDDFSSKPGSPNHFGLVGSEANAIAPGKRMLSSMTPSILCKDGILFMVVGSPGGSTIITTVFQTILNVIDFKMSMNNAVQAGRVHSQWLPDEIRMEKNALDSAAIRGLRSMGHRVTERESIGRCDAILVLPDHTYEAAADPRGEDEAEGY